VYTRAELARVYRAGVYIAHARNFTAGSRARMGQSSILSSVKMMLIYRVMCEKKQRFEGDQRVSISEFLPTPPGYPLALDCGPVRISRIRIGS
jgi:hypothetical protein